MPPKFANVDNGALEALLEKGVKIVDLRSPDEWAQTDVTDGIKKWLTDGKPVVKD